MWKYVPLFFIMLAGLVMFYQKPDLMNSSLKQTVSDKKAKQNSPDNRVNLANKVTVKFGENAKRSASSSLADQSNDGGIQPKQRKKQPNSTSDKKSKPKPVAVGVIESIWSMLKEAYPPDSEEYYKASNEFQQILDEDLVLQQVLKARKNGWNEIVSQVLNGELNPNVIVGEKVMGFSQKLWDIKQSRQPLDLENLSAEDQKLADQVKREMNAFAESKIKPLGPQSNKLIDVALGSTKATSDDIEILIRNGGELKDTQVVNVILAPNDETVKLERLKLLVEYGANINGIQAGEGMTSFEAAMVRGDIAIADFLVSMGANVVNTDAANVAVMNNERFTNSTREYLQGLGLHADQSTIEFYKKLRDSAARRAKEREENSGKAP